MLLFAFYLSNKTVLYLVVQKLDNSVNMTDYYPMESTVLLFTAIHCIVIRLVDGVIHPLND